MYQSQNHDRIIILSQTDSILEFTDSVILQFTVGKIISKHDLYYSLYTQIYYGLLWCIFWSYFYCMEKSDQNSLNLSFCVSQGNEGA